MPPWGERHCDGCDKKMWDKLLARVGTQWLCRTCRKKVA